MLMFDVVKKYVNVAEGKSGCDLCQCNIYVEETYYQVLDYEKEVLLTVCDLCRPSFLAKFNEM